MKEFCLELTILFVDQEKSVYRVDKNISWETIENCGVTGELVGNRRALNREMSLHGKKKIRIGVTFVTTSGVLQGCVLSLLLSMYAYIK